MAGPEQPPSAWIAMFPLSVSLHRREEGHSGGQRREPHCSPAKWGRLDTSSQPAPDRGQPLLVPDASHDRTRPTPPPRTRSPLCDSYTHTHTHVHMHTGRGRCALSPLTCTHTHTHMHSLDPTGTAAGPWDSCWGIQWGHSEPLPSSAGHMWPEEANGDRQEVGKGAPSHPPIQAE